MGEKEEEWYDIWWEEQDEQVSLNTFSQVSGAVGEEGAAGTLGQRGGLQMR